MYTVQYFKRVMGPLFFLSIILLSFPLFPSSAQRYILHNYVLNSDEGLTDRALNIVNKQEEKGRVRRGSVTAYVVIKPPLWHITHT
jgi:hypothetical protein